MKLGDVIKQIRLDKKLTLRDLAEKTGLSIGLLRSLENNKANPNVSSLMKICEALETSLHSLFRFIEQKPLEEHYVVRKNERTLIFKSEKSKTKYELLAEKTKRLKPVCITIEPGGGDYGEAPLGHPGGRNWYYYRGANGIYTG